MGVCVCGEGGRGCEERGMEVNSLFPVPLLQVPVIQRLVNAIAIQWISINKTNHNIRWIVIFPVDRVIHLSNNWGLLLYILSGFHLTVLFPLQIITPVAAFSFFSPSFYYHPISTFLSPAPCFRDPTSCSSHIQTPSCNLHLHVTNYMIYFFE